MTRIVKGVAGLLICLLPTISYAAAEPVSKIIVTNLSKQQYLNMVTLGLDVEEASGDTFVVIAGSQDKQLLKQAGIKFSVEEDDLQSFYAERSAAAFGGFRTYSQIVSYLDSLSAAYPTICSPKFSIGKTIEGRDMWVIKVSDNPLIDEDEPEVFYNSLIHAREPAGGAALLNVVEHLLKNYGSDADATYLVNNRELFFLPVTNPDGYVYNETTNPLGGGMWRKNRRMVSLSAWGVDLNRNFGFRWGYDEIGASNSTTSEVYRGSAAFSEPETQHLRDFIQSRHFVICHNFHTYANLFLWPYGYDRIFSHMDDFYRTLGDSVTNFNHYTPEVSWTLYPTNGDADDWAWGDTLTKPRIISVTTELGNNSDGFWPTPERTLQLVAENLQPNLYLARIADNPYILAPPSKPLVTVPDSVGQVYSVHWNTNDTINPPVSYRLYELTGKQTVTDDAEAFYGNWSTVRMGHSTTRKHSGSYSWHSQNANQANHWLVSNTPYLVRPNDSLRFWIWYNLETNFDYFYAQVSLDGGFTFINLADDLTSNVDPNNLNLGNGITGASNNWVRAAFDLSPYEGKQVIFRLTVFTDGYQLNEGVYLDDIQNIDSFASETSVAPAIPDTIYSFADKTPGEYWYRLTGTDAQGQTSRLSTLVHTTVFRDLMIGDLTGDGLIDLSDLSRLISYLLTGTPVPEPLKVANVNCAGVVDLSDLSYLIAYLVNGAPKPNCP